MEWRKILYVMPFLVIAVFVTIIAVRINRVFQEPQQQADASKGIDMDEPMNRPFRPVKIELFQPEYRFEVIGNDVTTGVGLQWVSMARTKGGQRMIFRALVGDPKRFPIERGKAVRLGYLHFWQNPGYEAVILVVLGIE